VLRGEIAKARYPTAAIIVSSVGGNHRRSTVDLGVAEGGSCSSCYYVFE